jgi:hypothetical protein
MNNLYLENGIMYVVDLSDEAANPYAANHIYSYNEALSNKIEVWDQAQAELLLMDGGCKTRKCPLGGLEPDLEEKTLYPIENLEVDIKLITPNWIYPDETKQYAILTIKK